MGSRVHTIESDFVMLNPELGATPVEFTPTLFEEFQAKPESVRGCTLVSSFSFEADWPSWERHPAGDEVVMLMEGEVTMVLEIDGEEQTALLDRPGSYVIVPKNTWHTARTGTSARMLFITPGEGTEHREA